MSQASIGKDSTGQPFAHRFPSAGEMELLRLLLSTFQDGSGQLTVKGGTLPGWRDFERAVAEVSGGIAPENKGIFDVLVPDSEPPTQYVGLSGKMRRELRRIDRDGRVTIELSNSARKMWDALGESGITMADYTARAKEVGPALVNLVEAWHRSASMHKGIPVSLERSSYLALMWDNTAGQYQLFQFSLVLPDPSKLSWYFTDTAKGHLNGDDSLGGRVFEWYGESGGQLKYYPKSADALWQSPKFRLEPLPTSASRPFSDKAQTYFPEQWRAATST